MKITCLLCNGTFEDNDAAMRDHFSKIHHQPIEEELMHYVIALQKKIEGIG
jgi:hypothetical protein